MTARPCGLKALVAISSRGGDQLAQDRALAHDLRVAAHVGRARHALRQRVEVGQAARILGLAGHLQVLVDGDDVGRLAGADQRADGAEDDLVLEAVEVGLGDDVGGAIPGAVVQQQAAEHALLGLDGLRRHAQLGDFVVAGFAAAGQCGFEDARHVQSRLAASLGRSRRRNGRPGATVEKPVGKPVGAIGRPCEQPGDALGTTRENRKRNEKGPTRVGPFEAAAGAKPARNLSLARRPPARSRRRRRPCGRRRRRRARRPSSAGRWAGGSATWPLRSRSWSALRRCRRW